jgi:monoamine oxidase
MIEKHTKYIIIGAGLSGLTTAHQLIKEGERDFIILEGRNQIGGRINTLNGVDLGATWLQSHHQYLVQLMTDLKVQKFEQYSSGKGILVYNTMAPAHYFENTSNEPSAYRIAGGSIALLDTLAEKFHKKIVVNAKVMTISETADKLTIQTATNKTFTCDKIISTIPPKLASSIAFEPKLPDELIEAMVRTHTWMSNAIKIGITYKTPFWRTKGLSGTIISQISPVTELYDHCDYNQKEFGLMGFVNEELRDETPENRKEQILSYLEKHMGSEIRNSINYYEKDWELDVFTSNNKLKSVYRSTNYGNPLFQQFYLGQKILFSGTETSQICGGYMEGAVYSGINAVNKLLDT